MKNRIIWIDILRIIGIIGVLFMHIVGNTINTYGLSNENPLHGSSQKWSTGF